LLRPDAIALSELPIEKLHEGATDPQWENYRGWFHACCALVAYRQGKAEEAIAWTEKPPPLTTHRRALALVVRAMAEHQLGRADQARQTLLEAEALIPVELRTLGAENYQGPVPAPPDKVAHDWLAPEILRREADALIKSSSPSAASDATPP
jgi:hypothetical protein